ncbi:gp53-like domain-containing protein, partial [Citrobacter portucalensis]|nr:phage tail protein [Citrobacter portucalensis]
NLLVKGPNGLIIQVFRRTLPNSTTIGIPQTLAVTYPTPFPVNIWGVFCTKRTFAQVVTSCERANNTGFDAVTCLTSGTTPDSNNSQAVFLAFGY